MKGDIDKIARRTLLASNGSAPPHKSCPSNCKQGLKALFSRNSRKRNGGVKRLVRETDVGTLPTR